MGRTEAMVREGAAVLTNLFFPIFCKQCSLRLLTNDNGFFCPTCWELSRRVVRPFCSACGRPHTGAVGFGTLSNFPCADCRESDPKDRPWRRIRAPAVYTGAVETATKLCKFNDKPRLAKPLAALMAEFAREELDVTEYDALVPVPLHRVRARDRGFNQARLLAQELLEVFPKARLDESLVRMRPTRTQSLLKDPEERRANVSGAFAAPDGRFSSERVLLIDDVVTTAGTVSECAATLRRAGAEAVDVFVAALVAST